MATTISSNNGEKYRRILIIPPLPLLLTICSLLSLSCVGKSCTESERGALLDVKANMYDPDHTWLASWRHDAGDCCSWRGVGCDNLTGRVILLDLHNLHDVHGWYEYLLPGPSKLSPSLLNLTYLKHLDLSLNHFSGSIIPENYIASLVNLEYLNLSNTLFHGTIPCQLGNLSNLHSLDLSTTRPLYLESSDRLRADELYWLRRSTSLIYLDLSGVDLSAAVDWTHEVNMIPSLSVLKLSGCGLSTISGPFPNLKILDLSFNNVGGEIPVNIGTLTHFEYLDLSGNNNINGSIPYNLGNLTNLKHLDLSGNMITGDVPPSLGNLASLQELDISNNSISGEVPESLYNLSLLQSLRMSNNDLHGKISKSMGKLSMLEEVDISSNKIEGSIPEDIGNLSSLSKLWLDHNMIGGEIPSSIWSMCNLNSLDLSSNKISGDISSGLAQGLSMCKHKKRWDGLQELYLGNNNLSGEIPQAIGQLSTLQYLGLGSNSFEGVLRAAHFANFHNLQKLDLSNNKLHGRIPNINLPNVTAIDLSKNSFSGPIPSSVIVHQDFQFLILSYNRLNGSIPLSLCNISSLRVLDLSNNHLFGRLPPCLNTSTHMEILALSNNSFKGQIPDFVGSLTSLRSLHLSKNGLSGRIPETLRCCNSLVILDLSENRLSGRIPTWIGGSLSSLQVLDLRKNRFNGSIPHQLAQLASLQVLDLSQNQLSGIVSLTFGNFIRTVYVQSVNDPWLHKDRYQRIYYKENIWLTVRGLQHQYSSVLSAVTSIDISDNSLSGEIPKELTRVLDLVILNLSRNCFTGSIPENIGNMEQLEMLDLSMNNLSGTIPRSVSRLYSLDLLNLSNNNLSGRIPSGNQLQTFDDPSIYDGNEGLCGWPLPMCLDDQEDEVSNGDRLEKIWFWASVVLAFVAGFWASFGTLLFKKSIRHAFFRFVDRLYDWVYVEIAVNFGRLKSMMAKSNGH